MFKKFSVAKGSCGEVRAQLYVALDQRYIEADESGHLIDNFKKLSIMINNFISYLKKTPFEGAKYKPPTQKSMKEEIEELLKEVHARKDV